MNTLNMKRRAERHCSLAFQFIEDRKDYFYTFRKQRFCTRKMGYLSKRENLSFGMSMIVWWRVRMDKHHPVHIVGVRKQCYTCLKGYEQSQQTQRYEYLLSIFHHLHKNGSKITSFYLIRKHYAWNKQAKIQKWLLGYSLNKSHYTNSFLDFTCILHSLLSINKIECVGKVCK